MHATIHVFTFREGLLSKLGHDLRLSASRFLVTARGAEVTGKIEPGSLAVDGAVKNGALDTSELSASDKQKIVDSLRSDVLDTRAHPEIVFSGRTVSRRPPFAIQGRLTIAGHTRDVAFTLNEVKDRLVGRIELKPSEWGIKPFRALGGALKVQDRIVVAIDASAEWLIAGAELNPAVELTWSPTDRPSFAAVPARR